MSKTYGQIAFEAYNNSGANPGKTYDGKPIPPWKDISEDTRQRWEAAANAVHHGIMNQFKLILATLSVKEALKRVGIGR